MTIQNGDKFIINRNDKSYYVEATTIMTNPKIRDDDVFLINRGTSSYKVSAKTVRDELGGGGPTPPPPNWPNYTQFAQAWTKPWYSGGRWTNVGQPQSNEGPGRDLPKYTFEDRPLDQLGAAHGDSCWYWFKSGTSYKWRWEQDGSIPLYGTNIEVWFGGNYGYNEGWFYINDRKTITGIKSVDWDVRQGYKGTNANPKELIMTMEFEQQFPAAAFGAWHIIIDGKLLVDGKGVPGGHGPGYVP